VRSGDGWLREDVQWDVEDVLGVYDEVARRLELAPLDREHVVRDGWHPGRTVRLLLDGVELGLAGQLHPSATEDWDLPEPVVAGELLLEALLHVRAARHQGPPRAPRLVRHPAMSIDVAVVAPVDVTVADVQRVVTSGAGGMLDAMWWFDEFQGAQLPDGHRSLGFRLRLQDAERQLTDEDADRVIVEVGAAVLAQGWSLRR